MDTLQSPERGASLQAAGWTKRFTALGRRLEEAVELYHQLGFEVALEPADPDEQDFGGVESCKTCFVTTHARVIYTRPRTSLPRNDNPFNPIKE